MKWIKMFLSFLNKILERLKMDGFIPRDEETGKIITSILTQAYIIKTSDGTPVAIAIKKNGVWYSIPYDKKLAEELHLALGDQCTEITIDEWARINYDYENIINAMDEKFNIPVKKTSNKLG